jgi:hypothetical protein
MCSSPLLGCNAFAGQIIMRRHLQYYVIKFVGDLRQVGDFLRVIQLPPSIKLTDITEILLKVALNTKNQLNQPTYWNRQS